MSELRVIDDIGSVSTQDLKSELARSLDITARHLDYLAKIWVELEKRGEDLSELRYGIMNYLPMIANRKIDSRLVVNYAGQKTLLAAISNLPIEAQSEIATSGYVTIVEIDSDGSKIEVQKKLSRLSSKEVYQVFADEKIRSPDEQFRILVVKESKSKKVVQKKKYRKVNKISIEDDLLIVSDKAVAIDAVLQKLSEHFEVDFTRYIKK